MDVHSEFSCRGSWIQEHLHLPQLWQSSKVHSEATAFNQLSAHQIIGKEVCEIF